MLSFDSTADSQLDPSDNHDHDPSLASDLWHSAYAHPRTSAAIAGALTIGTAAALWVSRGRAAALAPLERDAVLLIEDSPFMGNAFKTVLQEQGHKVTWLAGVRKLEPFTGVLPDGSDVVLNLRNYSTALVDGNLKDSLAGEQIVGPLTQQHVFAIGMSTSDELNAGMRLKGAQVASNKPIVLAGLMDKRINLTTAVEIPMRTQQELDSLRTNFLSPEQEPLRQAADALVKRFIKE